MKSSSLHPDLTQWLDGKRIDLAEVRTQGGGSQQSLKLNDEMLRTWPSGDLFGLTQNAGMGWDPQRMAGPQILLLSTLGGMRAEDGQPIALGYHTGHWEVGLQVRAAAETITAAGGIPFAAYCSDPCDGRTQGTAGMFDSLPYRNDAAIVMRRQIRSLPTRRGVLAVATCDKGLPATMMALAGCSDVASILVPGGVTLPNPGEEDTAKVQTIGARYVQGEISLEEAERAGCRACGSAGGGCQFLGTAATSQVIAEALGMTLPHAALAPSGQPLWLDLARVSATVLLQMADRRLTMKDIVTDRAIRNALIVHAACGGSTNLLLHIPAIAHAAGLNRPSLEDWQVANRRVIRFVDVLPNGPRNHPTVQFYLAGGVPEVMLVLRDEGLIDGDCMTVSGITWNNILDQWKGSERRGMLRQLLKDRDGVDADDVIMPMSVAKERGMTGTLVFPTGNLCPDGAVVKATSIDPSKIDAEGLFYHRGKVKVFTSERSAVAAIKGVGPTRIEAGDIIALIGCGPMGTGMEETYQLTAALKYIPWGKHVTLITDARFSGVSTGACIGHIGPEALAGGPLGRLRNGDEVEIRIDRKQQTGSVNLICLDADRILAERDSHPNLCPANGLPDDTKLWAILQNASGGTWGGCVYDMEAIGRKMRE